MSGKPAKTLAITAHSLLFFITSCQHSSNTDSPRLSSTDTASITLHQDIYLQEIDPDALQPLPSPLQVILRFKQAGMRYSQQLPYNLSNIHSVHSYFDKLILSGILSADFVYLIANKKTSLCPSYMKTIHETVLSLGFGDIINTETNLRRVENNLDNIDSIAIIASEIQMNNDRYFRENNDYLRGLIVFTGAWIETMHLALQSPEIDQNFDAIKAINEQKDIISRILANYQLFKIPDTHELQQLIKQLHSLKTRLEIADDASNKEDIVTWRKEMENLKNTVETIRNYYTIKQ